MVIIHTTFGDIKLQLDTEKAPATVANFAWVNDVLKEQVDEEA